MQLVLERLRILHFFDDDKFIDPAIKLFESVYPNQSFYFVFANTNKPFRYVKSKNVQPLFFEDGITAILEVIEKHKIQALFFHALNFQKQKLVHQLDDALIKVWFIWGFDLYSNWKLLKKNIYEKETKKVLVASTLRKSLKDILVFNNLFFSIAYVFKSNLNLLPPPVKKTIKNNYFNTFYTSAEKIDIVVPVIPDEFDLVKKMKINPEFAPFTYGCIEDMLNGDIGKDVLSAKNILVGNSANPSNNHIDVFKKLSKLQIKNRKIIVPLSYGGDQKYIDLVILKGKHYFKNSFMPLVDFMPLADYNQIISTCGYVVFNHVRQQAVGNIISLGYLGAKLFLNHKSPVYKYYKKVGVNVFDITNLTQKGIDEPLSLASHKVNKELFTNLYSEKAVLDKIKKLFEVVALMVAKKREK